MLYPQIPLIFADFSFPNLRSSAQSADIPSGLFVGQAEAVGKQRSIRAQASFKELMMFGHEFFG
jgi:hypothetical protein